MGAPLFRRRLMSLEEYLRFEESVPDRHEFVAGEAYAMSGASLRHNTIILNIASRLRDAARGGPCRVYAEGVKLRVADDRIYYTDVMVLCTPAPADTLVATDPCLVVEVTSPGSAGVDRGEKLNAYRGLSSLRAYLIVDQRRRRVERQWRDEHGQWRRDEATDPETVPVPCIDATLSLDEIYEGVETSTVAEPELAEYEA